MREAYLWEESLFYSDWYSLQDCLTKQVSVLEKALVAISACNLSDVESLVKKLYVSFQIDVRHSVFCSQQKSVKGIQFGKDVKKSHAKKANYMVVISSV